MTTLIHEFQEDFLEEEAYREMIGTFNNKILDYEGKIRTLKARVAFLKKRYKKLDVL